MILILAGTGERKDYLLKLANGSKKVFFSGWLDQPKVRALLERADCGLVPYPNRRDFRISLPTKVGEYLSAGVPILSSLDGALAKFLEKEECGWNYNATSPGELAALILRLNERGSFRSARCRAVAAFKKHFDANVVYERMARWVVRLGATHSR